MALKIEDYQDLLDDIQPEHLWAGSKWEHFIKCSNQMKGRFGERIVMRDLKEQGWASQVNSSPEFDILVEDKYRVEVKIAAARKTNAVTAKTIAVDSMQWQHLDISSNKCDMFAFVGINPDVNYVFRKGWREEFDELFILYFTYQQLVDLAKDKVNKYLYQQYNGVITGKNFLPLIDFGKDYKKFTP